jgi:hypothetical protein
MKVSALLCASAAAFVVSMSLTAVNAAVPAASPNSKGVSFYRLSAGDAAAEKACTDKGGAVTTDQDGYKMCSLPRSCAAGGATRTVKLDLNDPAAAKKCQDACGTVSTDNAGAKVCTRPDGG